MKEKTFTVCFLGGSKIVSSDADYIAAKQLSRKLTEKGHTILTGGGEGIMEAGNKGAFSVFPKKSKAFVVDDTRNNYYTPDNIFSFLTYEEMRFALLNDASVIVLFPGGLGSLNEFFEYLLLVQRNKLQRKPLILFNTQFWKPLISWIESHVISRSLANKNDIDFVFLKNSVDEVIQLISKFSLNKKESLSSKLKD